MAVTPSMKDSQVLYKVSLDDIVEGAVDNADSDMAAAAQAAAVEAQAQAQAEVESEAAAIADSEAENPAIAESIGDDGGRVKLAGLREYGKRGKWLKLSKSISGSRPRRPVQASCLWTKRTAGSSSSPLTERSPC